MWPLMGTEIIHTIAMPGNRGTDEPTITGQVVLLMRWSLSKVSL